MKPLFEQCRLLLKQCHHHKNLHNLWVGQQPHLGEDQLPQTDCHLDGQNPLTICRVEPKLKQIFFKLNSIQLVRLRQLIAPVTSSSRSSSSSPCMWSGKDLWTCPDPPRLHSPPLAVEPANAWCSSPSTVNICQKINCDNSVCSEESYKKYSLKLL